MSSEDDFRLVMQPTNPNWVDVIYPEPIGPKYMINIANWSCTCKGDTIELAKAKNEKRKAKDCKHKARLKLKIHLTR